MQHSMSAPGSPAPSDRVPPPDRVAALAGPSGSSRPNSGDFPDYQQQHQHQHAPMPFMLTPSALMGEDKPDSPPSGCDADTFKLFVGNIPKSYTELQLLPLFETVGQVVDLVIVRDRNTHESKGSAFLWYATRAQAELAILEFHLRYILPDPAGENNRRLVLRKARSKAQSQAQQQAQAHAQAQLQAGLLSHPALAGAPVGPAPSSRPTAPAWPPSQHAAGRPGAPGALPGPGSRVGRSHFSSGPLPQSSQAGSSSSGAGPPVISMSQLPTYAMSSRTSPAYPMMNVGLPVEQTVQRGSHPGQYTPSAPSWTDLSEGPGGSGSSQVNVPGSVSLTMLLDTQQFGMLCSYLHSIQAISHAELRISPAPMPEWYSLTIVGMQSQVQAAKGLVDSLYGVAGVASRS